MPKLQQAKDAAGTGAKDITGKAITQLTQAGGDGDEIVTIPLRAEEIDIANAFTHIRVQVTTAVANVDYGAVLIRRRRRPPPANQRVTPLVSPLHPSVLGRMERGNQEGEISLPLIASANSNIPLVLSLSKGDRATR